MSGQQSPEAVIVRNLRQIEKIDPYLAEIATFLCAQLGHKEDYTPVGTQVRDDQARERGEFAVPLASEVDPPTLSETDREASYAGQ